MDLDAIIAMLPSSWAEGVGLALTLLIAIRTTLRAVVAIAVWFDTAKDGERNWGWPGSLADGLDWIDGKLARLPVKAPIVFEKRKHAEAVKS
jgi:hypothetical protein